MPRDKTRNSIVLSRRLRQHWLWDDKPFSKGQAWADLLLRANYADGKILVKGREIVVQRGQVFVSYLRLASEWGWDRKKVRRFLETLEDCKMIVRTPIATPNGAESGTLLSLVNYGDYQYGGTPNAPSSGTPDDPGSAHEMPTDRPTKCPPDGTLETLAQLDCIGHSGTVDDPPTAPLNDSGHAPHLKKIEYKGPYGRRDEQGTVSISARLPKR